MASLWYLLLPAIYTHACSTQLSSPAPLHTPHFTPQQQHRRGGGGGGGGGGGSHGGAAEDGEGSPRELRARRAGRPGRGRVAQHPHGEGEPSDVKKPDCVPGVDPHTFVPGIGGGHGGITPVPSHGGVTPLPGHGGSTGTTPSHGGGYTSPPHGGSGTSPSHGGIGTSPTAPSTGGGYGGGSPSPSHGGGGAYGSSPTPSHGGGAYGSSPATPSHGAYGGSTPTYGGGSPSTPSHGGIVTSSPPLVAVDPHSPGSLPGTCDYWRSHPMEMWSALGGRWPGTMGRFFGTAAGGEDVSIQDALANTRGDGAGALLREGAAALLNSMTRAGFPYTTEQVRDAFAAAAAGGSDGAAATQAAAFRKANEGTA
ncbi:hypothetical protein ACP4OV_031504 [Aristida adscensionis]